LKIVLVIFSLDGAGGAERIISLMAGYWAEKGRAVTMVTFDNGSKPPFYGLNSKVNHLPINLHAKYSGIFRRIKGYFGKSVILRRQLLAEKPDLIIAFTANTNVKVLCAMQGTGIPVIVAERNIYSRFNRSIFLTCYRNWLYARASAVVCQTKTVMDGFPASVCRRGAIIPNPVMPLKQGFINSEINLPAGKLLFAVGHMSKKKMYQKGFDLLLPVFSDLARKHPDWHLIILNDGPDKDALERDIENLGLKSRVHLPGKVKNICSLFKNGDLFVLSSRYEGFPNVLCEAMACGLPVVSFDCPSGPGEIIRDCLDGILVAPGDTAGLENALDRLMSDERLRVQMGQKAVEIAERYNLEKIMGLWEELIQRT